MGKLNILKMADIKKVKGISGGSPVIKGTRIRVIDIGIEFEYLGMSPDEIVRAHPHISLAQIHAALSYFYKHIKDFHFQIDIEIKKRHDKSQMIILKYENIKKSKEEELIKKAKSECFWLYYFFVEQLFFFQKIIF